jgi:pyrroline-5-carboxylate reductase
MAPPQIQDAKLCFIGGGNMGAAIIGGLLAKGSTSKQNIIVSEPFEGTRKKVEDTLGVRTVSGLGAENFIFESILFSTCLEKSHHGILRE